MPRLRDIEKFIDCGGYACDIPWDYLEEWITSHKEYPGMDIDPDFQREHVWTEEKQIAYVEFVVRGGNSAKSIWWNCPGWTFGPKTKMVLVDGKQRLQAVRRFLNDEIPLLGYLFSEYESAIMPSCCTFRMHVNTLKTRREVLTWYLQMNSGGVVHTKNELEKVERLLKQEA